MPRLTHPSKPLEEDESLRVAGRVPAVYRLSRFGSYLSSRSLGSLSKSGYLPLMPR